jgi:ArsR family transcriptional regulator, arsenate/arsenite/antimonite-responsive transcriptional repressor
MAFSKAHLFDPSDQIISAFAKALSHPVRLDILRTLSLKGSCSVEYLSLRYPISKSTLSQHLETLRKVGLIKYSINHPRIIYFLDTQALTQCNIKLQAFCSNFLTN